MLLRDLGLSSEQVEVANKIQTNYNERILSLLSWVEKNSNNKIAKNVLHHSYEIGEIMLRVSFTGENFNDTLRERGYKFLNRTKEAEFNNIIMKNSDYVDLVLSGKILLAFTLDFENMFVIQPQDDLMIQEEVVLN